MRWISRIRVLSLKARKARSISSSESFIYAVPHISKELDESYHANHICQHLSAPIKFNCVFVESQLRFIAKQYEQNLRNPCRTCGRGPRRRTWRRFCPDLPRLGFRMSERRRGLGNSQRREARLLLRALR